MEKLISPEESYKIIREAWDVFTRTDSNGNSLYEYKLGSDGKDTDGNGKYEIDCSQMVVETFKRLGYNLPPDFGTRELSNPNWADRYFGNITDLNDLRPGDLILFGKDRHVGIVENIWFDENLGKYVGSFFHMEGAANRTISSPFIYDANSNKQGYWYGDERPITKFLRPKESIHNVMSYQQWFIIEHQRESFTTAETVGSSPIILDLDGDGAETAHVRDGAYFDHDGNVKVFGVRLNY